MPFILLPFLLPLLAGLILLIIHRMKPDFGYFWIITVLASLAAWGGLLALRWQVPVYFSMNLWQEIGFQVEFPFFLLDAHSWPYAFSLSSLVVGVILTAPVRISRGSNPNSWAGSLAVLGISLMGVLAANPLTMILAWSGLDLLELVYTVRFSSENSAIKNALLSYAVVTGGTFLAVWAMIVSQTQGLPLTFNSMSSDSSQFLVLAAGVRLAVFPITVFFRQDAPPGIGLGTLVKFAGPSAALVLLARLPAEAVSPGLSPVLFTFTLVALVFGAVMWLRSKDETEGRSYWILSFSTLAIASLMQGRPDVSPVWGSAMVLGGGMLTLYTVRQTRLVFIPLVAFLCLTGIIFTPVSAGWAGIWMEPFKFSNVFFISGVSLLLAGYIRHAFRLDEVQEDIDRWVLVIYPTGLIMIAVTFVLIGVWSIAEYGVQTAWIGPGASVILGFSWLGLSNWLRREKPTQSLIKSTGRIIGKAVSFIISLKWLYRIVSLFFLVIKQAVFWLTNIFEGDGGVLWAILVLLLLVTLIRPGVMP